MLVICDFCGKTYNRKDNKRFSSKRDNNCSKRCAYFLRKKNTPQIELDSINEARRDAGLKELNKLPKSSRDD